MGWGSCSDSVAAEMRVSPLRRKSTPSVEMTESRRVASVEMTESGRFASVEMTELGVGRSASNAAVMSPVPQQRSSTRASGF